MTDPTRVIRHLWGLVLACAKRYIGHSPAGGAMIVALLVFLTATVTAGLIRYDEEEGGGPLAPLYTLTSSVAVAQGS